MRLLAPLGLLGLLGVVALIIIYIIKPNYQQRFISSTFVWKLSLKYRKRKIPINKLRNLLLIICQILILTLCTAILSRPNEVFETEVTKNEYILVVDSSASMRTVYENETRFDRAINMAIADATAIFEQDGVVSVVVADDNPAFLSVTTEEEYNGEVVSTTETFRQVNAAKAFRLEEELTSLSENDTCSYGSSNMDRAMELCQEIIDENPTAKVYLYTDTNYNPADTVVVKSVNEADEWNAGILSAKAEDDDSYFMFSVEVGYFVDPNSAAQARNLGVTMTVRNANAYDKNSVGVDLDPITADLNIKNGEVLTLIFKNGIEDVQNDDESVVYFDMSDVLPAGFQIASFESVEFLLDVSDNNIMDDRYLVYGDQKDVIKVQYASSDPNIFVEAALQTVQKSYADHWDIQLTSVKKGEEYALEGFDMYLFEHEMPDTLPTDGVSFLLNPDKAPAAADFSVAGAEREYFDSAGNAIPQYFHTEPVEGDIASALKGLSLENVYISKQRIINSYNGYDVIATCNNTPVVLTRNSFSDKVVIFAFSMHFSNFANKKEFPIMMLNLFEYYFPPVIEDDSADVNTTIDITSMSEQIAVTYPAYDNAVFVNGDIVWEYFDELGTGKTFVSQLYLNIPGRYEIFQLSYLGREFTEKFFVSIPSTECNVWATSEMVAPVAAKYEKEFFEDLMLYFAAALVFFLFAEWLLHIGESA